MRKVIMATLLVLVGCGDGSSGIGLEFVPEQDDEGALTLSDGVELTRLEIQLREIKILPDSSNEDADKVKMKDLFVLDLVDGTGGTMPPLELEPGLYKKVEFKVSRPDEGEGIDGTEWSLWMEGSRDGVDFRFLDDELEKIELRDEEGVELEEGATESFLVDLDVPGWFDGVDMGELELTDGVAVIDAEDSNEHAHEQMEENIKDAIRLLRHP